MYVFLAILLIVSLEAVMKPNKKPQWTDVIKFWKLKAPTNFIFWTQIDRFTSAVHNGALGSDVEYSKDQKAEFKSSGNEKNLRKICKLGATVAGGVNAFVDFVVDKYMGKEERGILRKILWGKLWHLKKISTLDTCIQVHLNGVIFLNWKSWMWDQLFFKILNFPY